MGVINIIPVLLNDRRKAKFPHLFPTVLDITSTVTHQSRDADCPGPVRINYCYCD